MKTLTPRWFEIPQKAKEHPVQIQLAKDLLSKKYSEYIIAAGRRSFKTERFIKRFAVNEICNGKEKSIFIGAPTRIQAEGIFWKDIKLLTPKWLTKKISESKLSIQTIDDNVIQVVGLKEYKRIQGQMCHIVLLSEYQECDPNVWTETFEPMLNDTGGIAVKEGRPYGKNHFYDEYQKGLQSNLRTKSYHWTSEEILSAEQILRAKESQGKSDYQREYLASFETDSQSPYYAYTVQNNKQQPIRYDIPFILSCDFNATTKPMSWIFGQRHITNDYEETFWIKTFSNKFTNTKTQCEIVWDYFQSLPELSKRLILYGDYTGKGKESNSSFSDWEIILEFFRNKFSEVEQRTKKTMSIRNSIASTNAQLRNSLGSIKQYVNEIDCKELIRDWLKCEWKPNGRELNDDNDDLAHMCRAVDYYNDYEYSILGKPKAIWNN